MQYWRFTVIAVLLANTAGCATLSNSGNRDIFIETSDNRQVLVNVETPSDSYQTTLPNVITAKATFGRQRVTVQLNDPCYMTSEISVSPSFNLVTLLNIWFYPGFLVDYLTGKMWDYPERTIVPVKKNELMDESCVQRLAQTGTPPPTPTTPDKPLDQLKHADKLTDKNEQRINVGVGIAFGPLAYQDALDTRAFEMALNYRLNQRNHLEQRIETKIVGKSTLAKDSYTVTLNHFPSPYHGWHLGMGTGVSQITVQNRSGTGDVSLSATVSPVFLNLGWKNPNSSGAYVRLSIGMEYFGLGQINVIDEDDNSSGQTDKRQYNDAQRTLQEAKRYAYFSVGYNF